MMSKLISIFFLCISLGLVGQDKAEYKEVKLFEDKGGFSIVDSWAMYPNGKEGIYQHISENLMYPKKAMKNGIEGKVIVSFLVQTDGSVEDVKVIQGVHPLLDKEAVRIIRSMEKWMPAIQRGKKVKLLYKQEVNFSIDK